MGVQRRTPPTSGSFTIISSTSGIKEGEENPDASTITLSISANSDTDPIISQTAGAQAIRQKLVELHEKMRGKVYSIDSPEIVAAYRLFVETWEDHTATGSGGNLLDGAFGQVCSFATDMNFMDGLGFDGETHIVRALQNSYEYLEFQVGDAYDYLRPLAVDSTRIKRSWIIVMTYLMSHYNYLYE